MGVIFVSIEVYFFGEGEEDGWMAGRVPLKKLDLP